MKDILKDFFSVRSFITLGAFVVLYKLVWTGTEVPPMIAHIVDILLGFWFGSKITKKVDDGNVKLGQGQGS